jgi:hypothetical protein
MGDQRHKVGDVDPEGLKRLRESIAGKGSPPVKAQPPAPAKPAPTRQRRYGPAGQTIDEIANDAVVGQHDNQHTDSQQ